MAEGRRVCNMHADILLLGWPALGSRGADESASQGDEYNEHAGAGEAQGSGLAATQGTPRSRAVIYRAAYM